MTRSWSVLVSAVVLLGSAAPFAQAGERDDAHTRKPVRAVRLTQAPGDLGLNATLSQTDDGGVALRATSGDLAIEKVVYADGRYRVAIVEGTDRVTLTGEGNAVRVGRGRQAFRLGPDADLAVPAEGARQMLALSRAVARFRQLVAELDHADAVAPEALSLRLTGAVLAEAAGDPGAVRRLSRALTRSVNERIRRAQSYPPNCWDMYVYAVAKAARELEACYGSFYIVNPMRQVCSFVWTIQVEAAWFAMLGCSAVPLH